MDPEDLLGKKLPFEGGLRLESILGYGSFATVYKAATKEGKVYAVKWLNKVGMSEKEQALQKDEVMYMKILGEHKNIIRLYDVIETSDSLFLILEFCTTDLYELITQSEKQLDTPLIKRYFNEICDGVKHCHSNHIYHRDLKPENILLSDDDHCKISDFGLCCFDEWTNDFNCGSLRYMSPECIENEDEDEYDDEDDYDDEYDDDSDDNYYRRRKHEKDGLECNSKGSDVWALGVILINMIFGQNPWSSADMENPTFNMFIRKDPDVLQRKLGLSDEFNRVVKHMFSKNVFDRYSLEELRTEVNRIEVFTDFSKRVTNYLGIDEDFTNTSDIVMKDSKGESDSQYDKIDEYDDWYQEDIYPDHNEHVVVPDIDTLELEEEEDKENEQEPNGYSLSFMKNKVPFISNWGDDLDDEDMASELTPRIDKNEEDIKDDEEEEEESTSKMATSLTKSSYYDNDVPMSWENRNDSTNSVTKDIKESNSWKRSNKKKEMAIYDSSYKNKLKEWEKEEEEDQLESEECLMTPTPVRIYTTNKNKETKNSDTKPTLSKKKSVQLRWEDLFSSDEENKIDVRNRNNIDDTSSTTSSTTGDRFQISEQALPSSWNYQQGLSWGDMMDDDDFIPSKPQLHIMTDSKPKPKPTPITTAFMEDSEGDEILFKKEKVPVSSEVSSLITPSLLTNGMQKKLLSKKAHKEKKSSTKNKNKGTKESLSKDKGNRHHHKSKKDKECKEKEETGAIKIKNSEKRKHHHSHIKSSSLTGKSSGKEKKSLKKSTEKSSIKHRKHKTNTQFNSETNNETFFTSSDLHNIEHTPISNHTPISKHTPNSSNESNHKSKNKNKNKNSKHHKREHKSSTSSKSQKNTSSISPRQASLELDWEDLFSSDGEAKTTFNKTKTESIKTSSKSFSVDESIEDEDDIFGLSNNIKALDIENEKGHNTSLTFNNMVDSAISVSETNLSKEIKILNLH